MQSKTRREFIRAAAATAVLAAGAASAQTAEKKTLILGVACSPRRGKTTAAAVQAALDAAKTVSPAVEVELIDLGGLKVAGWSPAPVEDDFTPLLSRFKAPELGGLIIGTPVYFRNMSSLCSAFLERLGALRQPQLLLANKAVGALSVGGYRNGGQELAIQQILTAMLCHEAIIVGGKPSAHQGATLWNAYNDDIMQDEFGIDSAKKLGIRVAEAALK